MHSVALTSKVLLKRAYGYNMVVSLSPAGIHLVADEAVVLEARVGHSAHNQSQAVV